MSDSSQEKHVVLREELVHELRQFTGISASFFRAAAARLGMTVTDMQVIDLLESTGPATAGQLADLTGLTTGAITGMLNRLEETGLVHRERDPNDGRRVIVQLAKGQDDMHRIDSIFASFEKVWHELAEDYDDEQLASLLDLLKRGNALSRKEIVQLRDAPEGEGEIYSAPLGELSSGRLVVSSAVSQLTVRADEGMADLYQARFEGSVPDVKAREGVVTIRYPRRLWVPGREQRVAQVALSAAIPWQIVIQGSAAEITARLGGLNLAGLEVKGGASMIHLDLPMPASMIPVRISGGASEIAVRRPADVAARAHLKGRASTFVFDDQTFSDVGNDVRLQSTDFNPTAPCYDIEVASSVSTVTISSV